MVERGLAESRNQASRLILAGAVLANGLPSTKPGLSITKSTALELIAKAPYVSRGGLKLEKALAFFEVDPTGRTAVDIGSSTGGFTDCLLKKGASKVYAVDSGTHQLHESLRRDPRVVVMENTNARYLDAIPFSPAPNLLVMDVSFISIAKITPSIKILMTANAEGISLVKPQFEADPDMVESRGLVSGMPKHVKILDALLTELSNQGLSITGLIPSPITGEKSGNIEYLVHFYFNHALSSSRRTAISQEQIAKVVAETVEIAHHSHKK